MRLVPLADNPIEGTAQTEILNGLNRESSKKD